MGNPRNEPSSDENEEKIKKFQKACENGDLEVIQEILKDGSFPVDTALEHTWSGLQHAVYNGRPEICKFLLKQGANPNFKRYDEMNVLHAVTCSPFPEETGPYECLTMVLEAGGDMFMLHVKNITPLIFAVKRGHEKMVKLLLERGSQSVIDHQDNTTRNALDWASLKGYLNIVRLLLEFGASVVLKNKHNETSSDVARHNGFDEIANILYKCEATMWRPGKCPTLLRVTRTPELTKMENNLQKTSANEKDHLHFILKTCDLDAYFPIFQTQNIDYIHFLQLTENNLKDVGITDDKHRMALVELISDIRQQATRNTNGYLPHRLDHDNGNMELILENLTDHAKLLAHRHEEMITTVRNSGLVKQMGSNVHELISTANESEKAAKKLLHSTGILLSYYSEPQEKLKEANAESQLLANEKAGNVKYQWINAAIKRISITFGFSLIVSVMYHILRDRD